MMSSVDTSLPANPLIGVTPSRVMKEILEVVKNIALSDLAVLVVGEAGTEKEWLARRIHDVSGRAGNRFVSLDCSLLSQDAMASMILGQEDLTLYGVDVHEGILEAASGGTLFLDNITVLSPMLLKKLASIIEFQHFRRVGGTEEVMTHVRFVLGAGKILDPAIDEGHPERDISHRLSSVIINLPPMRDRREDIVCMIREFMSDYQQRVKMRSCRMSGEALRICYLYDWPGNAQELKMVVEHSMKFCAGGVIQAHHLPEYLRAAIERQFTDREGTVLR